MRRKVRVQCTNTHEVPRRRTETHARKHTRTAESFRLNQSQPNLEQPGLSQFINFRLLVHLRLAREPLARNPINPFDQPVREVAPPARPSLLIAARIWSLTQSELRSEGWGKRKKKIKQKGKEHVSHERPPQRHSQANAQNPRNQSLSSPQAYERSTLVNYTSRSHSAYLTAEICVCVCMRRKRLTPANRGNRALWPTNHDGKGGSWRDQELEIGRKV